MSNASLITNQTLVHAPLSKTAPTQAQKMSAYYRFHAKIYDLTRWTFLFGRHWLIDWLPFERHANFTLLEVGCGTGHNMKYLAQSFPKARFIGIDASGDMLSIAQRKLSEFDNEPILLNTLYGKQSLDTPNDLLQPQAILFSYCLSMVNPDWDKLILQAKADLTEGGVIAVVDFHKSKSRLFKKWMSKNHVRMDEHLLPFLQEHFNTVKYETRRAYFGLWYYTLYIGYKSTKTKAH